MTKTTPRSAKPDRIESGLLRRINERRLFEVLQQQGPASRASLTRLSGLTAPTVSKAVESLLARGFVEEIDPVEPALGRPGKLSESEMKHHHPLEYAEVIGEERKQVEQTEAESTDDKEQKS